MFDDKQNMNNLAFLDYNKTNALTQNKQSRQTKATSNPGKVGEVCAFVYLGFCMYNTGHMMGDSNSQKQTFIAVNYFTCFAGCECGRKII